MRRDLTCIRAWGTAAWTGSMTRFITQMLPLPLSLVKEKRKSWLTGRGSKVATEGGNISVVSSVSSEYLPSSALVAMTIISNTFIVTRSCGTLAVILTGLLSSERALEGEYGSQIRFRVCLKTLLRWFYNQLELVQSNLRPCIPIVLQHNYACSSSTRSTYSYSICALVASPLAAGLIVD